MLSIVLLLTSSLRAEFVVSSARQCRHRYRDGEGGEVTHRGRLVDVVEYVRRETPRYLSVRNLVKQAGYKAKTVRYVGQCVGNRSVCNEDLRGYQEIAAEGV